MNEDRSKSYKYDTKDTDLRKRREDHGIQLRKVKREKQLSKRRNYEECDLEDLQAENSKNSINELINRLNIHAANIQNGECEKDVIESIRFCRRLLSKDPNPPIDEIILSGVVPSLISFLTSSDCTELQFESTWALTNLASGSSEQTAKLVDLQIIPALMRLLSSPSIAVVEQSIWTLGNIGGDCPKYRDHLLCLNLMPTLIQIVVERKESESLLRNTVWCISNLCRGKHPKPDFNMVKLSLPLLSSLLTTTDTYMLIDVCWSMSYLTDGDTRRIQTVIEHNIIVPLVHLLRHSNYSVVSAVLRTIGNILTGEDSQTQDLLDAGVLANLAHLLGPMCDQLTESMRKEVCWTLSNVAAGTRAQIQLLLDCGVMPNLIRLLGNDDISVKKEAAWTMTNAVSGGDVRQINALVKMDCIEPLCALLTVIEPKIIMIALTALEMILKGGQMISALRHTDTNPYTSLIEQCDGQDKIEYLQNHMNEDIYMKSFFLLDTYFVDQDDIVTSVLPTVNPETGLFEVNTANMDVTFDF